MSNTIDTKNVTKPIQLLATLLIGLILIIGEFLTIATQIKNPEWASGLLVVSSIVFVPVFLLFIFIMQTKFRVELQDDKYYNMYLENNKILKEPINEEYLAEELTHDILENINLENKNEVKNKIVQIIENIETENYKGVLFDTNKSYDDNSIWEMMNNNQVSAYDDAKDIIDYLEINDRIFYVHQKVGLVSVAKVISETKEIEDEKYKDVEFLSLKPNKENGIKTYLSFKEISKILQKKFYWARTIKVPYLNKKESEQLLLKFNSVSKNV